MKKIMVLTKNILAEVDLQTKLQQLNFEVFVTSQTMDGLFLDQMPSACLNYFDFIVISELITESEMNTILPFLQQNGMPIFRKVDKVVSENVKKDIQNNILSGWICASMPKDRLRDLFSSKKLVTSEKTEGCTFGKRVSLTDLPLSKNEKKFFSIIYESNGKLVTREELCLQIWKRCDHSTMSQLSSIKKRIEKKLRDQQLPDEFAKTSWGKGYVMNQHLYEYIA
ncbi:transcriptional regulator [Enterococcus florum]|uniref:Transcriptional regulator n=1 Tax=Enterococcus florum TaxID=2480627 RepID=A0A4P5P8L4_9ENTE|nr:helix-turn-helix domain-containing protein [Enterococcus florum]GCF93876.1 transcriptional regulator [Enterococcus florum]